MKDGWTCEVCGRGNREGARRCLQCGGAGPREAKRANGQPHGKARWDAGVAILRQRHGDFGEPHCYGGQERLARASDAEIDLLLVELEADLREAREEADEAAWPWPSPEGA